MNENINLASGEGGGAAEKKRERVESATAHREYKFDGLRNERFGFQCFASASDEANRNRDHDFDAFVQDWEVVPRSVV